MSCPHCHASNYHLQPKVKISRGYAGQRIVQASRKQWKERPEPNIILHQDCRSRVSGNINTGLEVVCEGCNCVFNCWTGNVDDGEYIAPITKSPEILKEEAVAVVQNKKRDNELEWLQYLRKRMGNVGFCYFFKKQSWYAKFGGTVWKLTSDDIRAIRSCTWDTSQTKVIKHTFDNKGIKVGMAKTLLVFELVIKKRELDN